MENNQLSCDQEFLRAVGSNPETKYLVDILQNVDAVMRLFQAQNPEPYTLFLPNESQWNKLMLSLTTPEQLLYDEVLMLQLLATHMVKGSYSFMELLSAGMLETTMKDVDIVFRSQGERIYLGLGDGEEYQLSQQAMAVCSSVVYILDGVLIPETSRIHDMMIAKQYYLNLVVDLEGDDDGEKGEDDDDDDNFYEDMDEFAPAMEAIDEYEPKDMDSCEAQSAYDIIQKHPQLKIMRELVSEAELVNLLKKTDVNMTLFLPVDGAEITAGSAGRKNQASLLQLDQKILKDIVRYHIVMGELVILRPLQGSKQFPTLLDSQVLTVQSGKPYPIVQGQGYSANIVDENVGQSCTVMVHLLDRVLMPYSPQQVESLYPSSPSPSPTLAQQCDQTVWDVISAEPGLEILKGVENRVDQALLQNNQQMTVFLPNERGQAKITQLSQELGSTLEDPRDIAYDLILNHIVANSQLDFVGNSHVGSYSSLTQLPIKVVAENGDYYAQATGSAAKVIQIGQQTPCSSIVVHKIDGALLPFRLENSGTKGIPSAEELYQIQRSLASGGQNTCNNTLNVMNYLLEEPSLSLIVEKAGDELEELLQPTEQATYFLPVNRALAELLENEEVMNTFKSDSGFAKAILQYHAIPNKLITINNIARMPSRDAVEYITRFNSLPLTLKKQFGSVLTIGQQGIGRVIELSTFESCTAVVHLINTVLLPFALSGQSSSPTPTSPTPSPLLQTAVRGTQFVEVQAVATGTSRGDNILDAQLQVVDSTQQSPSGSSTQQSNQDVFSNLFPSQSGVVTVSAAAPASLSGLYPQIQEVSSTPAESGCNQTIAALLVSNDRLSQMDRYMRLAGFANFLDQPNANITIIAPISDAFDSVLTGYTNLTMHELAKDESQRELFVKIISYHIIPYPVNVKDTPVGTSGSFGTLQFDDDGYQMQLKIRKFTEPFAQGEMYSVEGIINNATVSGQPFKFCKAFVYPVDKILSLSDEIQPPAPPVVVSVPGPYRPTVDAGSLLPNITVQRCIEPLQIIQNQRDLSTFTNLVYYANINEVINGLDNITIFAPLDQNLNQILSQFTNGLEDVSPQVIQNWMAYHIVTGSYTEEDLNSGLELESLTTDAQGNKMKLKVEHRTDDKGDLIYLKGVFNEAHITRADLKACNAVIHIVNMPLIPVPPENNRRRLLLARDMQTF
eukprot:TRINITY_DN4661_c1_g1_i4.p1 TRINITY_DN4661_c1_g1~~TRINITY_DN4661_c1_g1_i4.p1  ORF type:complete len:1307 (-),score=173.46 TRINITY_DN4661_c1_g1_i4:1637-5194(-)